MSEVTLKTDKELTIELRNIVRFRAIEYKANIIYWKRIVRTSKANTPEIVEAMRNVKINQESLKKDEAFIKDIDSMLKK